MEGLIYASITLAVALIIIAVLCATLRKEMRMRRLLETEIEGLRYEITVKQNVNNSLNAEVQRLNRKIRDNQKITTLEDLKNEKG